MAKNNPHPLTFVKDFLQLSPIVSKTQSMSMVPTINPNENIRIYQHPIELIKTGDIVAFYTSKGTIVAHRVIKIQQHHQICLTTKGDANPVADKWIVTQKNYLGKVRRIRKFPVILILLKIRLKHILKQIFERLFQ
jgi:signal peptidase I